MWTITIVATLAIWGFVATIIILAQFQRRRLALALLIDVWYMLEEMRTNTNTDSDQLWVNQFQTVYDALLQIADSVDPAVSITLMEHIEFSQWLHQEEINHDQT